MKSRRSSWDRRDEAAATGTVQVVRSKVEELAASRKKGLLACLSFEATRISTLRRMRGGARH